MILAAKKLLLAVGFLAMNGVFLYERAKETAAARRPPWLERAIVHHGRVYAEIEYWLPLGIQFMRTCHLKIVEKQYKEKVLQRLSLRYPVQEVDFDAMLSVVTGCQDLQQKRDPPSKINLSAAGAGGRNKSLSLWTVMKGIVPGTKWCGFNDIAVNYHDLGENFDLDKCCRAHDHCPVKIKSFSQNFGIKNYHPYTKSHCDCDELFYNCLKKSRDDKSMAIGNIFFNVLGLQCAEPKYPKVCVESEPPPGETTTARSSREGRLFFGMWEKVMGAASAQPTADERVGRCIKWADDVDAPPKMVFRMPRKSF